MMKFAQSFSLQRCSRASNSVVSAFHFDSFFTYFNSKSFFFITHWPFCPSGYPSNLVVTTSHAAFCWPSLIFSIVRFKSGASFVMSCYLLRFPSGLHYCERLSIVPLHTFCTTSIFATLAAGYDTSSAAEWIGISYLFFRGILVQKKGGVTHCHLFLSYVVQFPSPCPPLCVLANNVNRMAWNHSHGNNGTTCSTQKWPRRWNTRAGKMHILDRRRTQEFWHHGRVRHQKRGQCNDKQL